MKRTRPPNRLVTTCHKIKAGEFIVYAHVDRRVITGAHGLGLGPVEQIGLTPKAKSGSGLDRLFADLTTFLNREIQVKEIGVD